MAFQLDGQGHPITVWWYATPPNGKTQDWLNPSEVLPVTDDFYLYLDREGVWEVRGAMHWKHRRPDMDANGHPLPTPTPEPDGEEYEIPPPPGLTWKDVVTFEFEVIEVPIFTDGFESGGHDRWSVVRG